MIYVDFELMNGRKVSINPYCVAAVVDESSVDPVLIVLSDGLTYGVKGTFGDVVDELRGYEE